MSPKSKNKNNQIAQKQFSLLTVPDKTIIQNDTCVHVFMAALVAIARHGNSLNVHPQRNEKEDATFICNGILSCQLKRNKTGSFVEGGWTSRLSDRVKSEREKQIMYINARMWNLER